MQIVFEHIFLYIGIFTIMLCIAWQNFLSKQIILLLCIALALLLPIFSILYEREKGRRK